MKGIILEFNETGNSVIDVDFVCKKWNDKYSISVWKDGDEKQYSLIIYGKAKNVRVLKSQISKEQAFEVINKLGLLEINDTLFRSASVYKTKSFVNGELERFNTILAEKRIEMSVLTDIISSYEYAKNNIK